MKNAAQETRTASQSTSGRFIAYREYIIVARQQKINHGSVNTTLFTIRSFAFQYCYDDLRPVIEPQRDNAVTHSPADDHGGATF